MSERIIMRVGESLVAGGPPGTAAEPEVAIGEMDVEHDRPGPFLPQMLHRLFGGRGQRDLRHARIEQRLFQNHAEDSVILHHKHVVRQCLG